MKRIMRKFAAFLVAMLLVGSFSGCTTFDASAYVKAILDNVYFNDSTGLVEMELGTAEEASAIYEKGIDALVDVVLYSSTISDELREEYYQLYKKMYSSVKYTVGEAVEIDDTTFEVPVTCEMLKVFENAVAVYETKVSEWMTIWSDKALAGEEVPTDEEMTEQLFTVFKDCLSEEMNKAAYGESVTVTVKVQNVNDVWTINQEDMLNLEYTLIDFDVLFITE